MAAVGVNPLLSAVCTLRLVRFCLQAGMEGCGGVAQSVGKLLVLFFLLKLHISGKSVQFCTYFCYICSGVFKRSALLLPKLIRIERK